MANIKTITKKLVNAGYSENKLMMMTEKEIREAYKTLKEESIMNNNANNTTTNNSATVDKEETTMRKNDLATRIMNLNRRERLSYVWSIVLHVTNTSDELYIDKAELAQFLFDNDIIGRSLSKTELKKTKRQELIEILDTAFQNLSKAERNSVPVGDFSHDNAPESNDASECVGCQYSFDVDGVAMCRCEEDRPCVKKFMGQNPAPVSDAKTKTIEVLKLIKIASIDNKKRGFGTTVSAYMLCAYILQAGYGIKKLKGHESEITDEQKDTVKKVRQWLIDKGYIKACVYKTDSKSVYTEDYDGNRASHMISMNKSNGLTCVGVSSYKVNF